MKSLVVGGMTLSSLLALTLYCAAEGLTIEAKLEKQEYVLGEPVVLIVALTNKDDKPIPVQGHLEPEFFIARYFVKKDEGQERQFKPLAFADAEFSPITLNPNQVIVATAKIFFGAEGWTFSKPGQYSIRVQLGGNENITSKTSMTVLKPRSDVEKQQADLLINSRQVGTFLLFEGGDHLKVAQSALKKIAQSDSPLAGYANYALGTNLSNDFADFTKNRVRKADLASAKQLLDKSADQLSKAKTFYYTAKAHEQLADIYSRKGQAEKARLVKENFDKKVEGDILPLKELAPALMDAVKKEQHFKIISK